MPEPPPSLSLSVCRAGDVSLHAELNGSRVTSSIPQLMVRLAELVSQTNALGTLQSVYIWLGGKVFNGV